MTVSPDAALFIAGLGATVLGAGAGLLGRAIAKLTEAVHSLDTRLTVEEHTSADHNRRLDRLEEG